MDLQDVIGMDPEEVGRRPDGTIDHALRASLLQEAIRLEQSKGIRPGELPLEVERERQRALDSPAYLATEILDPYYKEHFEPIHYAAMDEVLGPFCLGETVRIEGSNYDPSNYLGLIVEFSRDTFKSSMMWLLLCWVFLHTKLRQQRDTRAMYVHQVIKKAIRRGENVRNAARHNADFRRIFPEFRAPVGEWDTKEEWRWSNFGGHGAGEFSFIAYGETSDKTGGHYTLRIVDDWETEESVTTALMQETSHNRFRMMDNLKDRSVSWSPYVIAGTTYHYQGVYKRLERDGGYLLWRVPGHKGSPKVLFDLCSIPTRTKGDLARIEQGLTTLERDRKEDLNFPRRLNWRELYQMARAQGPYIYSCQVLLDPVPEGEQRFDPVVLGESWVTEIPSPGEMWVYIRIDPAISEKRSADETAIVVGGVKWDATRWLIDGWIGREKRPTEIVKKAFAFAEKWQARDYKVKNIGIESVAYQEALSEIARHGVPERKPQWKGESVPMLTKPCPIRSINRGPRLRKQERILEMDGPVTRRAVKFWKSCSIAKKVMGQFVNFPMDRDDSLDAMHDLWVGVSTPPPEMADELPPLHQEMMKLIGRVRKPGDGPVLVGTNNTVKLGSWG